MSSPLPYIFALSVICTPITAQTASETDSGTPTPAVTLSEKTMAAIAQDSQAFVEKAINSMFRATSSGVITKEVIAALRQMNIATLRSRKIAEILVFDLDGSFSIEPEEIEIQIPHLDTRLRTMLETYRATADLDRDGTLSTEEIKEFVGTPPSLRESRNARALGAVELMQFDANGDGQVTPAEIGEVVAYIAENGSPIQSKSK
jgi:Ca2+-binding EF-hand superfamily protein